jgi:hypothetical protein
LVILLKVKLRYQTDQFLLPPPGTMTGTARHWQTMAWSSSLEGIQTFRKIFLEQLEVRFFKTIDDNMLLCLALNPALDNQKVLNRQVSNPRSQGPALEVYGFAAEKPVFSKITSSELGRYMDKSGGLRVLHFYASVRTKLPVHTLMMQPAFGSLPSSANVERVSSFAGT